MRVLVACEYSGLVRDAFTVRGHDAISCDILPTERPGRHYQGDVFDIINNGFDLMIAHPPCTFLTCAAEWAYKPRHEINKNLSPDKLYGAERGQARIDALEFVKMLWNADINQICVENPVGVINRFITEMPRPQYIQPYQFGHDASKKTGLWLKNLPNLVDTVYVPPRIVNGRERWGNQTDSGQNKLPPSADRGKIRSATYPGIALAMAGQWGGVRMFLTGLPDHIKPMDNTIDIQCGIFCELATGGF